VLRKLFGRKNKDEDDEDFDDEDFDDEDFDPADIDDEDGDSSDGQETAEPDESPALEDTALDPMVDEPVSDSSTDESDRGGEENGEDSDSEDTMVSDDDSDDEDFDDEVDDDEYEDDEDEDESRLAALWGSTWGKLAIIGVSTLLLLGGVGIGGWMFISSGVEKEIARQAEEQAQQSAASGGGLQPSSQFLNSLSSSTTEEGQPPVAEQFIPPPTTSNEAIGGEQLAGNEATSGLGASGGLNAIGAGGGTGGLNSISTGGLNAEAGGAQHTPGSGVVVPVSTASSYNQFPDYPTNDALSKAPTPDLLELRDGELPLPKIAGDGRVSWQEYARPSEVPVDKKRVALLVSGLGLSRAATLSAISKLPAAVSLSFSPYAEELEQWMIRSRREGHEVVLGLPLESNRFPIQDPGPLALLTILPKEENQARLDSVLSSQQGYIGVEVMMGTKYSADEFKTRDLLTALNERGLMVIDGAWNNRSLIPRIAAEIAMPRVISSVRLDGVMAKAAIDAKLRELDTVVSTRGSGVGATTITPAILERLLVWISSLPGKGVELVPVSAMITTKPAQTAEQ